LIDAELYLPESWRKDHNRCDKARVPENKRTQRSKLDIALTRVERAKENRLDYGWIGTDSLYGRDRAPQQALDVMGEYFVLDMPNDFRIYQDNPKTVFTHGTEVRIQIRTLQKR
jgi:SRSO17 transposase